MDPGSTPVAARTRSSLESFNNLLSRLPEDNNDHEHGKVREHVVDNLRSFKIWAGSIGADDVDKISADHRLREEPEIRQHLLELLDEVLEVNEELLAVLTGEDVDTSLEGYASDDLIEICLCVGDCISSLLKVSALLRDATGRDRYVKAVALNEPAFLEGFDIHYVECKYPKVSRSPRLAKRLGRANALRRQNLRYARKHHDRLAHGPIGPTRPDIAPTGATNTLSVSGIEQRTLTSSRPALGQTEASALPVDRLPQDESGGFNIENPEGIRPQATSVMTSNTGYRECESLEVIPLSVVCKDGQPFECPYCWTIIQRQSQRSWKRHVLQDIRAWACTFTDCSFGLFEDRESWFQHELEAHRRQWVCLSCAGAIFDSSAEMEGHFVQYHPAISTSALPRVVEASSRPVDEIPASACPLCDEWEHHLKKQLSDPEGPDGVELKVPARVFEQHLSHHLVQLALFSVSSTLESTFDTKSTEPNKNFGTLEEWRKGVEATSEVSEQGSIDSAEVAQPGDHSDDKANATSTQTNNANPGIEVQGTSPSATDQSASEVLDLPAYQNVEPSLQGKGLPESLPATNSIPSKNRSSSRPHMEKALEDPHPSFIMLPVFSCPPSGPLQLGTILRHVDDHIRPDTGYLIDFPSRCAPPLGTISQQSISPWSYDSSVHRSPATGLMAGPSLLFGSIEQSLRIKCRKMEIKTFLPDADYLAAAVKEPRVKTLLNTRWQRLPLIYMVTGLMIAHEAEYKSSSNSGGDGSVGGDLGDTGAMIGAPQEPFVLAYQVVKLEKKIRRGDSYHAPVKNDAMWFEENFDVKQIAEETS